jgi:putative hydrolase
MSEPDERSTQHHPPPTNQEIAACFEELAGLLEAQGANLFRVRAYRTAALNLRELATPAHELLAAKGTAALLALPGIGHSLARSIEKLCRTRRLALLQRLRGEAGPEHLFQTLPGIGPELAGRIHEELGVENLFELEAAARDGRLTKVSGFGRKRIQAIQESLRGRFHSAPAAVPVHPHVADETPVGEILEVDREYREKAAAGQLRLIAPQRFNPTGKAWLPVMHTQRGDRHYSALYSNTARAHDLGMTHDWVVVYRDDHDGHGQWTVITARYGQLRGHRIIRGREAECDAYYSQHPEGAPPAAAPARQGLLF